MLFENIHRLGINETKLYVVAAILDFGGHLRFLKNGNNSSFEAEVVTIPKNVVAKTIAKIPSALHNPLHYYLYYVNLTKVR